MRGLLAGLAIVLVLVSPAAAQRRPGGGSFGGGFRGPAASPGPAGGFRMIQAPPGYRQPNFARTSPPGFYPGYGFGGGYGWGGYGYGGFVAGGYSPYFVVPQPDVVTGGGGPAYAPVAPEPSPASVLSGQLPATLVVQFPAAARVWLDGVALPGDPDTDWTLTSKALRPGETATFRVRGRWEAAGKTYEAVREIPLGPGARSRLLVVSGTEVKE